MNSASALNEWFKNLREHLPCSAVIHILFPSMIPEFDIPVWLLTLTQLSKKTQFIPVHGKLT